MLRGLLWVTLSCGFRSNLEWLHYVSNSLALSNSISSTGPRKNDSIFCSHKYATTIWQNTRRRTLYNLFYSHKNGSCKYILYWKYQAHEITNHSGYNYLTWGCKRSTVRPKCVRRADGCQGRMSLSSFRKICTTTLSSLCPSGSRSSAVSITHDTQPTSNWPWEPCHPGLQLASSHLNGSVPSSGPLQTCVFVWASSPPLTSE